MKLFLNKIFFFIFLLSAFSAYTQNQSFSDRMRCFTFPDLCTEPEKPPLLPLLSPDTQDDPISLVETSQLSKEDEQRRQIFKMALVQKFQKNPNVFWAVEFAARGKEAYKQFEISELDKRISRDAFRIMSNVKFNIGARGIGVGISVPDLNKLESTQERRIERQFEDFKPEMNQIVGRAEQMTYLYFICEDQTFDCPAFHDSFQDTSIDSQELAENLNKAFDYGYKNDLKKKDSSIFPIGKSLEYLQSTYPEEAHFTANMQNLKNTNLEDQAEAFAESVVLKWEDQQETQEEARVAHIKANDSFYTGKDSTLLNLDNKNTFYKNELEKIKLQISSSSENISQEKLHELLSAKKNHETTLDRIDKAKKLHKHKQFVSTSSAWIGAATAVANTIGMPKEVVQFGQAAGIGMKIFDAGMSMFISGALDPTGITAIVNGVSALAGIIFGIKSAEQIMQESLNRIEKNTEKILQKLDTVLANQEKILGKLDHISETLDYMTELMQKNHREIIENFAMIKKDLNQMAVDMQFGFNTVLTDHRRQDIQSVLRQAYGYTEELSSNSDNFTCTNNSEDILCLNINKTRSDARIHLNTMFTAFEQISEFDTIKDFSKLSKTEIEKYLHDSSIEEKLPFLSSMVDWLNTAEERLLSEDIDNEIANEYVLLLGGYLKGRISFATDNYDDYLKWRKYLLSNINFGTRIPTLPQNIRFPSYQDQILSEYVKLASLLPSKEDLSGNFVRDKHIDQMCKNFESVESLSQIMRNNIQRAWTVYHIYSLLIAKYVQDMDRPNTTLKFKIANSKKQIQESMQRYLRDNKRIPYSYRQGVISSYELTQHLRSNYKISEYFTNFSKIVNKTLNHILVRENWNDHHFIDYGYIKQVLETRRRCSKKEISGYTDWNDGIRPDYSCVEWKGEKYTVYVNKVDKEAFKQAQIREWSWYPAYIYTHIIRELNKNNLIADWMRAKLAVKTMAQAGYGVGLSLHPELSLLNNLIETLPARREPLLIPEYFNPQTKVFSYIDLNQIAQFFKDIESTFVSYEYTPSKQTFPLIDYAQATTNRINSQYSSEHISSAVFINQNFCETTDFRATATISNIRNLMQFLNSPAKEDLNEKFESHYLEKEKAPAFSSLDDFGDFLHLKLNRAINDNEPFDLLRYINTHHLQFLLDSRAILHSAAFLSDPEAFYPLSDVMSPLIIYQGWRFPPCHNTNISKTKRDKWFQQINKPFAFERSPIQKIGPVEQQMKQIQQDIKTLHNIVPHGNLSLIYHLPLPSEDLWQNQPVGLGLYELRRKALLKAELFEHLKPQDCQINASFSQ